MDADVGIPDTIADPKQAIADQVRTDVQLWLGDDAVTMVMLDYPLPLSESDAAAIADAALAGLTAAHKAVVPATIWQKLVERCRCEEADDEPSRECPVHGEPEVMLAEARTAAGPNADDDAVTVSRADLIAYLNRGTGDMYEEAAALNRLLAAAGIE